MLPPHLADSACCRPGSFPLGVRGLPVPAGGELSYRGVEELLAERASRLITSRCTGGAAVRACMPRRSVASSRPRWLRLLHTVGTSREHITKNPARERNARGLRRGRTDPHVGRETDERVRLRDRNGQQLSRYRVRVCLPRLR